MIVSSFESDYNKFESEAIIMMKVILKIKYDNQLEEIKIDDEKLDGIESVAQKSVKEWFEPSSGRDGWNGLLAEIYNVTGDDDIKFKVDFDGPDDVRTDFLNELNNHEVSFEFANDKDIVEQSKVQGEKLLNRDLNDKALKKLKIAADLGDDLESQYKISKLFWERVKSFEDPDNEDQENIDMAIKYSTIVANKDNVDAIKMLYRYYFFKYRVTKYINYLTEAHYWLEKGAKMDNELLCILGIHYFNGLRYKEDPYFAFNLWKEAASNNCAIANDLIGWCYFDGIGTNQDLDNAKECFQKAIDLGDKNAKYHMQLLNFKIEEEGSKSPKNIFESLIPEQVDSYVIAERIGSLYMYKLHDYDQDYAIAYKYISRAVEIEKSLEKDYKKFDYNEIDDFGYVYKGYAEYELGKMYASGCFGENDESKMSEYMKKSIALGYGDSYKFLADVYATGQLFGKKYKLADLYYSKYLKLHPNDLFSLERLTSINFIGNGEEYSKDYDKSFKYASSGADKGSSYCMYLLAKHYDYGLGVTKNKKTAFLWYEKSANSKDPYSAACFKLGTIYESRFKKGSKGKYAALAAAGAVIPVTNFVTIPVMLLGGVVSDVMKEEKFKETENGKKMVYYFTRGAKLGDEDCKEKCETWNIKY